MKPAPNKDISRKYNGLSIREAEEKIKKIGRNEIEKKKRTSSFRLLLSQFVSPLILILLAAAGVTFFLGDYVDMYVILAAVLVNTVLGFYQEFKAQRSLEALASVLSPSAKVLRSGKRVEISATELVPGDLVFLHPGDKVPADGILMSHKQLSINEAILTGESRLVNKTACNLLEGEECGLRTGGNHFTQVHERDDSRGSESVYMGTTVSVGVAEMMVIHTGHETEVGTIAKSLSETMEGDTPLQERLNKLSGFLTVVVLVVALLIFFIGLSGGSSFEEMFALSVAVAVSAIPEGLAVSLTAILAIGMRRILKRKALVRKLVAAEVLGSVSVICSDKTGTLTEGQMKVAKSDAVDEEKLLLAASLGNDLNDPLEIGMWDWAKNKIEKGLLKKLGEKSIQDLAKNNLPIDVLPFNPEDRYAAKLFEKGLFVVGAPETVLSFSKLNEKDKQEWKEKISMYASGGLRIVGFGFKGFTGKRDISKKMTQEGLTFLGVLAYEDPVRRGVGSALKKSLRAGIEVKVITGDYRETARGVMKRLGWDIKDNEIIEGEELRRMSENELKRRVSEITLFARTTPDQKLKIVDALQGRGEVVAMTGDGVNDAPALKKSDIGVVVSTASDVSKETADMVLLDNNFSTIVAAVEEGRGIFENLRKVILYLLSDSFTEVLLVLAAVATGMPMPITAAQILWVNLVDDGLPNLALTIDPKSSDLLKRKPRRRDEPIIDLEIKVLVSLISIVTATLVFGIYVWYLKNHGLTMARTMAFATLGVDSLLYVFSSRSLRRPIWEEGLLKNKWLVGAAIGGFLIQLIALYVPFFQRVFETHPLGWNDWLVVMTSGFIVLGIVELIKWVFLHNHLSKAEEGLV
ncbi:cation-translocating P-type ATPase [Patescibacteria group bacterium]